MLKNNFLFIKKIKQHNNFVLNFLLNFEENCILKIFKNNFLPVFYKMQKGIQKVLEETGRNISVKLVLFSLPFLFVLIYFKFSYSRDFRFFNFLCYLLNF